MTDRSHFLRRAGAGAAGFSLAQLLGPAAALAGDGGGDFPATRAGGSSSSATTRSIRCSSPRSSARRTPPRSCAARCSGQAPRAGRVKETVTRAAVGDLAQGGRDRRLDPRRARVRAAALDAARAGGDPAGRLQRRLGVERAPVRVRRREPACVRASASGSRSRGWLRRHASSSSRREQAKTWTERRLQGIIAGLAASSQGARGDRRPALGRRGASSRAQSRRPTARSAGSAGSFAVDGLGTLASRAGDLPARPAGEGRPGRRLRPASRRPRARRRRDARLRRRPAAVRPGLRAGAAALPRADLAGAVDPVGHRRPRCCCARRTCRCSSRRRAASRAARAATSTRFGAPDVRRRWLVLAVGHVRAGLAGGRALRARRARARAPRPLRPQPDPGRRACSACRASGRCSRSCRGGSRPIRSASGRRERSGCSVRRAALAAPAYAPDFASLVAAARDRGRVRREHQHGDRPRGDQLVPARDARLRARASARPRSRSAGSRPPSASRRSSTHWSSARGAARARRRFRSSPPFSPPAGWSRARCATTARPPRTSCAIRCATGGSGGCRSAAGC